jgi:ABC-type uncharacterized transport system substrate-binding protein
MARDPVQLGIVASLSHPGGNITGFSEMNTATALIRWSTTQDFT